MSNASPCASVRGWLAACLVALAPVAVAAAQTTPSPSPSASVVPLPGPISGVAAPAALSDFTDDFERDFTLRSHGPLQITNLRGDIVIQGWPLDKIRVKAKRRARAGTLSEAKRLFSAVDFRFSAAEGQLELAAEYGRGLSLQERLREREQPRTGMQMIVYAPASLKLRIWGVAGKITVKNWDAPVDVRAATGEINIDGVKSGGASVLCPGCSMQIRDVVGPVRCMGESGDLKLTSIDGAQVYAETVGGSLTATKIRGEQLYVTKEGRFIGRELNGRIEFHAGSGAVEITESSGFLSGRTTTGDIVARMREWEFADKALIESVRGDIRLSLPPDFSGDVDLFGGKGPPEVGFGVERPAHEARLAVTQPSKRIVGRIRDGGELLKVFSAQGRVRVVRGE
jgi:hypothetical protein